jgi:hypothetical protein
METENSEFQIARIKALEAENNKLKGQVIKLYVELTTFEDQYERYIIADGELQDDLNNHINEAFDVVELGWAK